jgi:hypothetical protein
MEMFEICVTIYKPQRLRVPAETLEEAKNKVKAQLRSQRLLFEFDDITDAIIVERKEIPDVIPQMSELRNEPDKRRTGKSRKARTTKRKQYTKLS